MTMGRTAFWHGALLPSLLALVGCLGLAVAEARAGTIIGPGDIASDTNDSSGDIIAIDTTNSVLLAAGTYTATSFNYEFKTSNPTLGGTIQPLLLTGSSPSFTVVALGSTIAYNGDTPFTSTSFGGSSTFTLAADTTVYAGVYWDETQSVNRMPVGFLNRSGSAIVRFASANAPVLNQAIGGGMVDSFDRTYDFSVTVDAVPEPASILLLSLGTLGVAGYGWIRRQRQPLP